MTRIDKLIGTQAPGVETGHKQAGQAGELSFEDVLKQAVEASKADQTEAATAVQATGEVSEAQRVAQVEPDRPLTEVERRVLGQAYDTLDLLDEYSAALGDGGQNLKRVGQVVDRLEQEAARLVTAAQDLEADAELRGLVEQVTQVAAVEVIKFNRGDYLPAEA